jgi:hypothetical protein
MSLFRLPSRRLLGASFALAALTLSACAEKSAAPDAPVLPEEPTIAPNIKAAAFIFDVDRANGKVRVIAPSSGSVAGLQSGNASLSLRGGNGTQLSILAGDVIELTTENFTASGVGTGGAPAGRVFVSFDVRILNRLNSVRLVRPTFPAPPAGLSASQQVLLFPFAASTVVTQGGTSTTGAGDEVVVEAPSRGNVEAALSGVIDSRDAFDGAPHNFFDDTLGTCAAGNPNCFLYEAYPVIGPNENTAARRVGFVIDPTVNRFRARLLIAANLENAVATFGTISGTVSSPVAGIGALAGVTVNAGAGFSAVTNAQGQYSIANVPTGNRTVSIGSALPAGCSASAVSTTVAADPAATTVNFSLTGCVAPTGSVSGSISSSLGGALAGVGVIITPDGGSAQPTVFTAAGTGAFSAVLPTPLSGSIGGRITGFTNVPGNCVAPAPAPGTLNFTGLANGGSATIAAITFSCAPPPAIYVLTPTIRASTRAGAPANEREIVLNIDLSQNRSENYGAAADSIQGITFEFTFNPATVSPVTALDVDGNAEGGRAFSATQRLETAIFNPATAANQATLAVFSTGGPQQAGASNVGIFRFVAPSGATVNLFLSQAANGVATDLVPFFRGPSPTNALFSSAAPIVVTVP